MTRRVVQPARQQHTAGRPPKPSAEALAAAFGTSIPDLIAPKLQVLFCGINPGLYSGATGHHFARPGNRFWPTLHRSGFTPEQIQPWEEQRLLAYGLGITNLVARTTATAAELDSAELLAGKGRLRRKVRRFRPRAVAILGIGAYRSAFGDRHAGIGRQADLFGGAELWVLPNPSGLNANHQLPDLARIFGAMRKALLT